ncbi:MAG: DoxX family protein [Planctomycetota bacterium]
MRNRLPFYIRIIMGCILIAYGVEKLQDPVAFLKAIHEYDILPAQPTWILNLMPSGIPLLEIAAGLCLISGFLRRGAAVLMSSFLVLFTAAILWRTFAVMQETGQSFSQVKFDCGCGSGVVVIWEKLMFNSILVLGTIHAGFRTNASPS